MAGADLLPEDPEEEGRALVIADAVREVLRNYAEVDSDVGGLAEVLNAPEPPPWRNRFRDELAAAIRAGDLDPDTAEEIMFRDFADQAALDRWLRTAWAIWFPDERYPVSAAG
jgi:hypothetical protein